MGRTARSCVGGLCYHVLNRGNARSEVFHKDDDYRAFLSLMAQACDHAPMRILGFTLMPNHFHMVLWPAGNDDMSRWMHWLMTSHVARYHKHYKERGIGHVWQGRFKPFPIETGPHLLRVLRYVERNPLRAKLVERAEQWAWSSLAVRLVGAWPGLLTDWPVTCPRNWLELINQADPEGELEGLRNSVNRGRPYGSEMWAAETIATLGLESTVRPRGRPRKEGEK